MNRLILLSIPLLTLVSGSITHATITTPYTVDEKPQVLFGDSTSVLGYLGLENYAQDIVGGHIHITFTYTHSRCCFASYPPSIYVTNVDPRATTTLTIKSLLPLYSLLPIPIPPGHETDWYSYDIQFDATGYRTIVKERGEIEVANVDTEVPNLVAGDWIALVNQYPDLYLPYSMSFTPIEILYVNPPPGTTNPVIIIPGIMGSAYKNDELMIDPILHTYDDLIATLDENGYTSSVDLFTFPYEWRDSNVFSANLLDGKIEEVKSICGCDKVDLVAHSMGGLVARAYIQSISYDQDVDQLIFLGTPHKGAPKAYTEWEGGQFAPSVADTLTHLFFEAEALRNGYLTLFDYIHNRPIASVQELLPIFDYLKNKNDEVLKTYPDGYPRNLFLENLNDNVFLLLSSEVKVTNIIGNSGSDTIEKIRLVPSTHSGLWQHGEPEGFGTLLGDNGLERGMGDNTVTLSGAGMQSHFLNEIVESSHRRIPTLAENRIVRILTGNNSSTNIDSGFNLSPKVLLLQLLSPIDVVVTAPDGKKIGKNFSNGAEYNEIPGAFYSGFETDNEYITILNPLDGEYKVEVQGTGGGGEYEVLTSYISDDTSVTKETAGLTQPNQVTILNVDVNNDNPEEISLERIITSQVLLNDINKAYELGWITDKKLKDKLVKKAEAIIKIEKKKNGQTEKLEAKIDKKAAKALITELKGFEKGKINQQAYDIIKADLEWLINN